MITGREFVEAARRFGFDFFTSVPCSLLTPLLNAVLNIDDVQHVRASSEGEAVGIAAGAFLAGRKPVIMMQNSGLGNAVNPLTSLNSIFRIPSLLIVSWRGAPSIQDEPQHAMMGAITHRLLDMLNIAHLPFPSHDDEIEETLRQASEHIMRVSLPFALVVNANSLYEEGLNTNPMQILPKPSIITDGFSNAKLPSREDVLRTVVSDINDAAIVATTGKTGRELYTIADRPENLYLVGSMGCASAVALGVALNSNRRIVLLDGDGAALMKLGNLTTIGSCRPKSLIHVLIDNGAHDSTGGQPTNSDNVDFPAIAAACGYAGVHRCHGQEGFAKAFRAVQEQDGPHFLHIRTRLGSMHPLGRPRVTPAEVALRFASCFRDGQQTPTEPHIAGDRPIHQPAA